MFFFNINHGDYPRDTEGTVLPDLASAQRELILFASETLNTDGRRWCIEEEWSFEVTDASGLILYTLEVLAGSSPATAKYAERRPDLKANSASIPAPPR